MKRSAKYLLVPSALLCAIAVILYRTDFRHTDPIPAGDEASRLAWLASQGLSCEAAASAHVTVPASLDGAYADYAALQVRLGLPLASHSGEPAMLYTYYIKGSDPPLYAELLTADGVLIGAQCYCPGESVTLDLEGNIFQAPSA